MLRKGIFCIIMLFLLYDVHACKCVGSENLKNAIKQSDVIFVGKVLLKDTLSIRIAGKSEVVYDQKGNITNQVNQYYAKKILRYKVLLLRVYKGHSLRDTVDVYTARDESECGMELQVNDQYIIYASNTAYLRKSNPAIEYPEGENRVWVNRCTRTQVLNRQELYNLDRYFKK